MNLTLMPERIDSMISQMQATSTGERQRLKHDTSQPENPFSNLIPDQNIAIVPSFELENGVTLFNVPVAYKTYGKLSKNGDNCIVICHAVTGSSDVGDWWGPLLGDSTKAFDITHFFIVCINSLGSPYGSVSPLTYQSGDCNQKTYGPDFPLTTIRDDVKISKIILDDLGVKQIASVIGGSMGGMLVLEFAYFGTDYVRSIVPIATSPRYSAWGISWGEAQRQSIYSDPKYEDGYYSLSDPPSTGLSAARMSALLTYRSRDSFESRFGRNVPDPSRIQKVTTSPRPITPANDHFSIHNDGHRLRGSPRLTRNNSLCVSSGGLQASVESLPSNQIAPSTPPTTVMSKSTSTQATPTFFSAQSYLRYQGDKFIKRFDANCYIAMTRKLDTHDVSRGRYTSHNSTETINPDEAIKYALSIIQQPTLVLGIESDGLFTYAEQQLLAAHIPNATLKTIDSPDGHDAFLLEFEQVNSFILEFQKKWLGDILSRAAVDISNKDGLGLGIVDGEESQGVKKTSTFGEAEGEDITEW